MKTTAHTIYPLGDTALTIDFGNLVDEKINEQVIALFHKLNNNHLQAMKEAVPAYSSLTVYYDFFTAHKKKQQGQTAFEWMKEQVTELLNAGFTNIAAREEIIRIPVCYDREFATDIETIAGGNNISIEEIVRIHTAGTYKVFMLGFLPGFTYMATVDERISFARKQEPVNVEAGSVGIAGRQTGIYPLTSPGGWQIIGRTPLRIFDTSPPKESFRTNLSEGGAYKEFECLIKPGDVVQFYSITKDEFEDIKARNT